MIAEDAAGIEKKARERNLNPGRLNHCGRRRPECCHSPIPHEDPK
jgi:hypothetical protein